MSRVYFVVRHPKTYRGVLGETISPFYEVVKNVPSIKEGKDFCEKKNISQLTKYYYDVKYFEVKTNDS